MAKKPVEVEATGGERQATLAECNEKLQAAMLATMKVNAAKKGEIVREVVYMPAPTEQPTPEPEPAAQTDAPAVQ